jgi:hypothetical protein
MRRESAGPDNLRPAPLGRGCTNAAPTRRAQTTASTKTPTDHSRCGAYGPLAHIRVFARRHAAMDPAATRGLRTGRDAALPAVHLRHWPCQVVHVPLPSLP